jgi:hypothetical protein
MCRLVNNIDIIYFRRNGQDKRAITQKIRSAEQQFLCTALLINKIYHPMKFQVYSFYNLGEMAWTKIKYEN